MNLHNVLANRSRALCGNWVLSTTILQIHAIYAELIKRASLGSVLKLCHVVRVESPPALEEYASVCQAGDAAGDRSATKRGYHLRFKIILA